jgi:hypothetical protein
MMMSTFTKCFEPVGRDEYLAQLLVFGAPTQGLPDEFWDEVHDQVQVILRRLDEDVCHQVSGIRVAGARTKGRNFLLFSYRTFERRDDAIDPVVAGITISASGDNVFVEADISGEERGDLIATAPRRTVVSSQPAVVAAAREVATELASFGRQLAAAMCDEGRRID